MQLFSSLILRQNVHMKPKQDKAQPVLQKLPVFIIQDKSHTKISRTAHQYLWGRRTTS